MLTSKTVRHPSLTLPHQLPSAHPLCCLTDSSSSFKAQPRGHVLCRAFGRPQAELMASALIPPLGRVCPPTQPATWYSNTPREGAAGFAWPRVHLPRGICLAERLWKVLSVLQGPDTVSNTQPQRPHTPEAVGLTPDLLVHLPLPWGCVRRVCPPRGSPQCSEGAFCLSRGQW